MNSIKVYKIDFCRFLYSFLCQRRFEMGRKVGWLWDMSPRNLKYVRGGGRKEWEWRFVSPINWDFIFYLQQYLTLRNLIKTWNKTTLFLFFLSYALKTTSTPSIFSIFEKKKNIDLAPVGDSNPAVFYTCFVVLAFT